MPEMSNAPTGTDDSAPTSRLSYKFQRLREQLRKAIISAEFPDKLPGERELGKRFGANAKTINKALCDLTAEGLLVRRIGRGTFVARDGGTGLITKRGQFLAFVGAATPGHYRGQILKAVRSHLAVEVGPVNEIVPERSAIGEIPLAAWPPQTRAGTLGLLVYPADILGRAHGYPSDDLLIEAHRRHVPIVFLGGTHPAARVNTVCPDYVEAGFRCAQHLHQRGCGRLAVLSAGGSSRETMMVISGAETACASGTIQRVSLEAAPGAARAPWTAELRTDRPGEPPLGLICIGSPAVEALTRDAAMMKSLTGGRLLVTCVLEPGDPTAESLGLTSYEVDWHRMAQWAAKLLLEAKPGQRPIDITVPGLMRVRRSSLSPNAVAAATPLAGLTGNAQTVLATAK